MQAPSRTGRRASHLDGLALCVSTFASGANLTGARFATQARRRPDSRNLRRNPGRALGQEHAGDDQHGGDQGSNPERLAEQQRREAEPETGTSSENGATVEAEYARIRYAHRPQPTVVAANAM